MLENNMIFLQTKKEIFIEDRGAKEWVYLASYYQAEKNVAECLTSLDEYKNVKKIDNFLTRYSNCSNSIEDCCLIK